MISFRTKKFDDEIWDIGKLITLLRKEVLAKERSFALGACFNDCNGNDEKFNFSPSALFPQSKILVNTDVYFATKTTTLPINV